MCFAAETRALVCSRDDQTDQNWSNSTEQKAGRQVVPLSIDALCAGIFWFQVSDVLYLPPIQPVSHQSCMPIAYRAEFLIMDHIHAHVHVVLYL